MSLFRPEVLESFSHAKQGSVLLTRPIASWIIVIVGGVSLALIFVFLTTSTYSRKAHLQGELRPIGGIVKLTTPYGGVLTKRLVSDGDIVEPAQQLFRIAMPHLSLSGDTQQIDRTLLVQQEDSLKHSHEADIALLSNKESSLKKRVTNLRAERDAIQNQIALQVRRVELASRILDRSEKLVAQNFISGAQEESREIDLIDQRGRLESLNQSLSSLGIDIETGTAELELIPKERGKAEAEYLGQLSGIEQRLNQANAGSTAVVESPIYGTVAAISASEGQTLTAAQAVMTIIPKDAQMEAVAFANPRDRASLHIGQTVYMKFDSFPFQHFGPQLGSIIAISDVPMAPEELVGSFSHVGGRTVYAVRIHLNSQVVVHKDKVNALTTGMTLEADVPVESRALIEWLFEPAQQLSHRLGERE